MAGLTREELIQMTRLTEGAREVIADCFTKPHRFIEVESHIQNIVAFLHGFPPQALHPTKKQELVNTCAKMSQTMRDVVSLFEGAPTRDSADAIHERMNWVFKASQNLDRSIVEPGVYPPPERIFAYSASGNTLEYATKRDLYNRGLYSHDVHTQARPVLRPNQVEDMTAEDQARFDRMYEDLTN